MFLIEIFLPVSDPAGNRIDRRLLAEVRDELTQRFGGLTVYGRSPATGLWAPHGGTPEVDDIVIYEIMSDDVDRAWWSRYRESLEARFAQKEVVIRATAIARL